MIAAFIHRAVMQGVPLLFGSTGEIITEKAGHLNLGIPGIMYVGGISGVIGAFFYEQTISQGEQINGFLAVMIPLLASVFGSLIMGLIYSFLTVTLRANQNVTGLALSSLLILICLLLLLQKQVHFLVKLFLLPIISDGLVRYFFLIAFLLMLQ